MKIHDATRFTALLMLSACAAGPWSAVMAAPENGCNKAFDATYQIGVTRQLVVSNAMPEGFEVRRASARGDGSVLASCYAGIATFEGRYIVPAVGQLVPLTVGGVPSGFGVQLVLTDLISSKAHDFPHRYQLMFTQPGPVRANHVEVEYRIIRMTGPVHYGQVDEKKIAEQWTFEPGGRPTPPFRHMEIYDLAFVRPSCSITSESINQSVDVGRVHLLDFDNPDRATPWKGFRLTVEECKEPAGLVADITFGTPADADPVRPDWFSIRGPSNVALEIGDKDKKTMTPGKAVGFPAVGTGEDFVFNVRMRGTRASIGGGEFSRPVTVLVAFR